MTVNWTRFPARLCITSAWMAFMCPQALRAQSADTVRARCYLAAERLSFYAPGLVGDEYLVLLSRDTLIAPGTSGGAATMISEPNRDIGYHWSILGDTLLIVSTSGMDWRDRLELHLHKRVALGTGYYRDFPGHQYTRPITLLQWPCRDVPRM